MLLKKKVLAMYLLAMEAAKNKKKYVVLDSPIASKSIYFWVLQSFIKFIAEQ